jgi:hypothetical protein
MVVSMVARHARRDGQGIVGVAGVARSGLNTGAPRRVDVAHKLLRIRIDAALVQNNATGVPPRAPP